MSWVSIRPPDDHIDNPIPVALAIASRITNVMITPEHLRRPILGAAIPGAFDLHSIETGQKRWRCSDARNQ